jgi:hypothetical protein
MQLSKSPRAYNPPLIALLVVFASAGCDSPRDPVEKRAQSFRLACLHGRHVPLDRAPISYDTDFEALDTAINWTYCVATLEARLEVLESESMVCPPFELAQRYSRMSSYEVHSRLQAAFNEWSESNPGYRHPRLITDEVVLADVALIETWPCDHNPVNTRQ